MQLEAPGSFGRIRSLTDDQLIWVIVEWMLWPAAADPRTAWRLYCKAALAIAEINGREQENNGGKRRRRSRRY